MVFTTDEIYSLVNKTDSYGIKQNTIDDLENQLIVLQNNYIKLQEIVKKKQNIINNLEETIKTYTVKNRWVRTW